MARRLKSNHTKIILAIFSILAMVFLAFLFLKSSVDQSGKIHGEFVETIDLGLPIYLTTMTHMESGHKDDVEEFVFQNHVDSLTYAMDLADKYGAVLTFESEKPFATANTLWGTNFLQTILDRGHGVGTHCDISESDNYLDYVEQLKENKKLVDALVGSENNLGCSGAGTPLDWVTGLSEAGFTYVNGIVGMHLLAVPLNNRPLGYDNEFILSTGYHDHIPTDLLDRTYLRTLKNTDDLEHDVGGVLVLSAGDIGKLESMGEGGYEKSIPEAELTLADVDELVKLLTLIDDTRDKSKISKVNLYFSINDWDESDGLILEYFFSEMQKLQNDGVVEWASQADVVKNYLAINN